MKTVKRFAALWFGQWAVGHPCLIPVPPDQQFMVFPRAQIEQPISSLLPPPPFLRRSINPHDPLLSFRLLFSYSIPWCSSFPYLFLISSSSPFLSFLLLPGAATCFYLRRSSDENNLLTSIPITVLTRLVVSREPDQGHFICSIA